MPRSVFISYARDASRAHAVALYDALDGDAGEAFLDTEEIGVGEPFPERLVDALYDARVIVIFAEPTYFTRRYCLEEFHIACGPFFRVTERPGATSAEKAEAVRGLVLALPPKGEDPMVERFPPTVQGRNWPKVDEIDALTKLVRDEVATNPPTLRERYQALGADEAERARFLASSQLPPPQRIGKIPLVPAAKLRPSINNAFVGRADDLWRIHHILATRGGLAGAAGLTGSLEAMGGVGKTRIALEYLWRFGTREWQGGLFWINAEQEENAESQLYDVLRALDPEVPRIEDVRERSGGVPEAVARRIRDIDGDRPLFIIDNVPEPRPGEQPKSLDMWCPVLGEVPVLATSRTRVSLGGGGSVIPLTIDALDPDAAVLLLTHGINRASLSDAEWKEIAKRVGHLPLALELLRAMTASGAISPQAVLELSSKQRLSEALDEGMEAIRYSVPSGALRGITEAFAASYDRLTLKQQYAARLIAWMAPEPIPEFILTGLDPLFTPDVRIALRSRSFVHEAQDSSGGYFGVMHRVLADFIRSRSVMADYELAQIASTILYFMHEAPEQGAEAIARARSCVPLVYTVLESWLGAAERSATPLWACDFARTVGYRLIKWWQVHSGIDVYQTAANLSARVLGPEHIITLEITGILASMLTMIGNAPEAYKLTKRLLDLSQRIYGEEHSITMNYLVLYANVLGALKRSNQSQEIARRAVEISQRALGAEAEITLNAVNALAKALLTQGKHLEAQEIYERLLEIKRRLGGDNHPDTIDVMLHVGWLLSKQGDYIRAQAVWDQAITASIRHLGLEHRHTTEALILRVKLFLEHGDIRSASILVYNYLRWILERDSTELDSWHRAQREFLEGVPRFSPEAGESELGI